MCDSATRCMLCRGPLGPKWVVGLFATVWCMECERRVEAASEADEQEGAA